ncbi:MAG: ribbon-helix-helix protein, CopG family [Kiritimatiellae bacterium]|nr:ribbon-helix-helix protein, CopG family [Kiritimatiellia bacterium]
MRRTTIMLPEDLKARAQRRCLSLGISLGELIRDALESVLASRRASPAADSLLADAETYRGPAPADLSKRHDEYVYGGRS